MNYFRCGGGSEKVTIDGEKVKDKMELQSFVIDYLDLADTPTQYGSFFNAACLLNNELYIVLTNNILYKWDGTTWTQVSTLPYTLNGSLVVLNGEIYAVSLYNNNKARDYIYKWDGTTWTQVCEMYRRMDYYSAVVLNDEIHVFGGRNPYGGGSGVYYCYNEHYKWDGTTWTQVSTLPRYMYSYSAVVLNDEIHVFGGCYYETPTDSRYYKSKAHFVWNGQSWASKRDIPLFLIEPSTLVINDEIHILGGYASSTGTSNSATDSSQKHYKYISDSNTYTEMKDLPYQAWRSSAVVLSGKIHVLTTKHFILTPTVYASPI